MESVLKDAKSLIESVGTYARLVIVGVWFPGFLLFCELAYLYYIFRMPQNKTLLVYTADALKTIESPVILTAAVILVLASSIATGYVARDVTFWLSDFWLKRGWPPTRKLQEIFLQVQHVYGQAQVDKIAAEYPVFRLATNDPDGFSIPRSPESYVREFCKLWLRTRAPNLSTEGIEIDINMDIGLVLPIAAASLVFFFTLGGLVGISLSVIFIAASVFRLYRINWARNLETEQAIVNFLFAHWEDLTTSPQSEGTGSKPSPADSNH